MKLLSKHIKEAGSLGIFKNRMSKWQPKFLNRFSHFQTLFLWVVDLNSLYQYRF